jgi:hypothetical protein
MLPEVLNNVLVITATIGVLGFSITYSIIARRSRSVLRYVLLAVGYGISLMMIVGILRRFTGGSFDGYEWLALFGYLAINVAFYALWAIVLIERRHAPAMTVPLRKDRHDGRVRK